NTPHIIDCISYHPIMQSELDNPANGMKALKHLKQTSSLLNTMKDLHLLQSQTNYVEFGAGKGQLSHWIKTTLNDSTDNLFLLVDRGTNRYKFDSKSSEDGTHFERLRIDIEHLDLDKVPSLKDNRRSIVAVSKHLCGAATDLSLRCLMKIVTSNTSTEKQEVRTTPYVNSHEINLSQKNESAPAEIQELPTDVFTGKKLSHTNLPTGNQGYNDRTSKVSSDNKDVCASMSHEYHDIQTSASTEPIDNELLNTEGNPSRLNGIVIALCCHHKCLWRNYVGKDFFKCQGLTTKDFNVISLLTSWATCAIKKQQLNSVEDPVLHSNSSDSKVLDTSQAENVPEDNPHVTQSKCERCKSTNLSTRSCERNSEDVTGTSQNAFDKDKEGEYWEIDEREQIGKMCKRLIDIGRIKYLQSHGFNVQLGHYVTPSVSLENVVLMASPK
ncbi:tRNA:m(4)X modification enzyme TRM13 homolog, partial [Saccoglossus kowalevskii]|uniref:tRNA:m(4)X modification enzyme TRM13 n=1 Tax=Saccoglossus kowalevskii TaxID=10224 RepID=A0ABM0LY61_SACKO